MTLSRLLLQLQQVDTQLAAQRQRLAEIERWLQNAPEVAQVEATYQAARKAYHQAERAFREAEARVQALQAKLARTEERLYGGEVRNPKALQDLQRERELLQRRLSTLETEAVEALLAAESAEETLRQVQDTLRMARERRAAQEAQYRAEQEHLRRDIHQLERRRQQLTALLPPDVLGTYEQLLQRGHGLAVAAVQDQACSACGAVLSRALLQKARDPHTLTFCAECGRILVFP